MPAEVTDFTESYFPNGVRYKDVMYPTVPQIAQHAFKNMFRNATGCCLLLYLVVMPLYEYIRLLPVNDTLFYMIFTHFICHTIPYAFSCTAYLALDHYKILEKYKRKRLPSQQTAPGIFQGSVKDAVLYHALIVPVLIYFLITTFNQVIPRDKPVQSFPLTFFHFVAANIVSEVGFFLTHAAAHTKSLYFIHKKHHQYIATIAISMEHAEIAENIIVQLAPTVFYCVLFQVPLPVYGCWILEGVAENIEMHSGYYYKGSWLERIGLTYAYRSDFHDFHHTANRGNFSKGMFMDAFFRTMTPYLRAKQKEREARLARTEPRVPEVSVSLVHKTLGESSSSFNNGTTSPDSPVSPHVGHSAIELLSTSFEDMDSGMHLRHLRVPSGKCVSRSGMSSCSTSQVFKCLQL